MTLTVECSPYAEGSPNSIAACAASAEIAAFGLGDYEPSERDEVIAAVEYGAVVGVIVWLPYDGCAFIGVGWTRSDRRRRGIYRRMVAELERIAITRGLSGIRASVNCGNAESLATHAALGITPTCVVLEKMFHRETGTGQ